MIIRKRPQYSTLTDDKESQKKYQQKGLPEFNKEIWEKLTATTVLSGKRQNACPISLRSLEECPDTRGSHCKRSHSY